MFFPLIMSVLESNALPSFKSFLFFRLLQTLILLQGGVNSVSAACEASPLHQECSTGAEECRHFREGPGVDCKAYQKCISTIFDNFGGKKIKNKWLSPILLFFAVA